MFGLGGGAGSLNLTSSFFLEEGATQVLGLQNREMSTKFWFRTPGYHFRDDIADVVGPVV